MLEFLQNYLDNIAETPKQYYDNLHQATINSRWEDTTQLYLVKEQKALPFEDEYEEHEAWISTVSELLVNTSKVYSDFVRILFKNIDHKQNYKGQYYKLNLDGEHEEYYICYDRMNKLTQTSDFKCVRCNNVLTWLNEDGNIIKYPCYLGSDITSTNNRISKDGTIPQARLIIFVQANEDTKKIIKNNRFLFEHSSAFKVEEVDNYMQEQGTDGIVTYIKLYVDYSAITPKDNLELNICDYYENNYELQINQDKHIKQISNFTGQLTCTATKNNEIIDASVYWETENKYIVSIDENGNYELKGNVGDICNVYCRIKDNPRIYDTVKFEIVSSVSTNKVLIVNPIITELDELDSIDITCGVYIEGQKQSDIITYSVNDVPQKHYNIEQTTEGYKLTNLSKSTIPLIITFSAIGCQDVKLKIKLNGLL